MNALVYVKTTSVMKEQYNDGDTLRGCVGRASDVDFIKLSSFVTYKRAQPNKLECYITLGWNGLPGTNTLAHEAHL